jgi:DNA-binding NarL/FixJ family response regulator
VKSASETAVHKYGLTNRERAILAYLVKGYSLPYIRNELYIAQSTIDMRVRHVYRKLDIHSRKELIDLIHSKELLEP